MNMLRKKNDGTYERQDSDGNWQPVSAAEALASVGSPIAPEPEVEESGVATMIDSLVDELNGKDHDTGLPISTETNGTSTVDVQAQQGLLPDNIKAEAGIEAPASGDLDVESAPGDFDLEVPGLVSGDKGRGTKAFQTVKERLKANARKRREPRKVEVGASAAQVVGPAKSEGTERRQARRAQERLEAGKNAGVAAETGIRQRYVNRPAPELMSARPKWVQDLFEAHFRSEHTLAMRRANNRMKISRMDYAIGWLTAFDKFREEPSLLRAKSGE